jgi:hypothetical protein
VDVDFHGGDREAPADGLPLEAFDIVITAGVLYHLQNPMQLPVEHGSHDA